MPATSPATPGATPPDPAARLVPLRGADHAAVLAEAVRVRASGGIPVVGDERWPDDTRVVFEAMDDPASPPDAAVLALKDDWAQAVLALVPGLTPAEVAQRLGAASDDTRFESGRRLQRHLREIQQASGAVQLEAVSLFDASDRLLKSSLRRFELPKKR